MNLKNQPPIFVPREHRAEIESLSKAALMDLVWDLAILTSGADETDTGAIMDEIRKKADIVQLYRRQAKAA